jgi:hypothetical protein
MDIIRREILTIALPLDFNFDDPDFSFIIHVLLYVVGQRISIIKTSFFLRKPDFLHRF